MTQGLFFLFNRINNFFLNCTSFCQVIYQGFLRYVGKCLPSQQIVMLWKIILFIKLFNLFIKLFYFILFVYSIVFIFTHDVIVTHDSVGYYVYEV